MGCPYFRRYVSVVPVLVSCKISWLLLARIMYFTEASSSSACFCNSSAQACEVSSGVWGKIRAELCVWVSCPFIISHCPRNSIRRGIPFPGKFRPFTTNFRVRCVSPFFCNFNTVSVVVVCIPRVVIDVGVSCNQVPKMAFSTGCSPEQAAKMNVKPKIIYRIQRIIRPNSES